MTRERQKTILFAGGGTSGHVNPALAIARKLLDEQADCRLLFMVTKEGVENAMIREAGFAVEEIRAAAQPGKFSLAYFHFLRENFAGVRRCLKLIKREKPQAVVGTGGYVSAPLILAARCLRVPYVLHEQNVIPGRSNRRFARSAAMVCTSFPGSEAYFPRGTRLRLYGNPVREEFFSRSRAECRRLLGLDEKEKLVVMMGGSLGSHSLNELVRALPENPQWETFIREQENFRLMVSSGMVNSRSFADEPLHKNIQMETYIDSRLWIPAADLLVGRAGAGFLAEAAAAGKPLLLIPFPNARDDHQRVNAELFRKEAAAECREDRELTADWFIRRLSEFFRDENLLPSMAAASRRLAKPTAAADIVGVLLEVMDSVSS